MFCFRAVIGFSLSDLNDDCTEEENVSSGEEEAGLTNLWWRDPICLLLDLSYPHFNLDFLHICFPFNFHVNVGSPLLCFFSADAFPWSSQTPWCFRDLNYLTDLIWLMRITIQYLTECYTWDPTRIRHFFWICKADHDDNGKNYWWWSRIPSLLNVLTPQMKIQLSFTEVPWTKKSLASKFCNVKL